MCQVSRVTCHVSRVTCQVSYVRCHLSKWKSGEGSWWRVSYQRGLPCLFFVWDSVDCSYCNNDLGYVKSEIIWEKPGGYIGECSALGGPAAQNPRGLHPLGFSLGTYLGTPFTMIPPRFFQIRSQSWHNKLFCKFLVNAWSLPFRF